MSFDVIFNFLSRLEKNNTRDWFEANKSQYLEAKAVFEKIVGELIHQIAGFDPSIDGLEPKKCIFRIYRDVRFSKDKSPYKTNFGASMGEGGRKSILPSYYIHVKPGNESFFGGGLYHPQPDDLKKVRQEIDYNSGSFTGIVDDKKFKKMFGELWGDRLKRPPKDYDADNPMIEYLKMKDFVVLHNLKDEDMLKPNVLKEAVGTYQTMKPMNDFLKAALQ